MLQFGNDPFSALVRLHSGENVIGEFLREDVIAIGHYPHVEVAVLVLLHCHSDDDSTQRVDLIRQGLDDAWLQNHTGTNRVLIMPILRPALSFQDALFELLVENLLHVEADMADSLWLKTIALRFDKYVVGKQR